MSLNVPRHAEATQRITLEMTGIMDTWPRSECVWEKMFAMCRTRMYSSSIHLQKVPVGLKSWTELFGKGEEDWIRFDDLETCKTTIAARFTSSGTTGLPKAVISTHMNIIAQHELVYEGSKKRPYHVSLWL